MPDQNSRARLIGRGGGKRRDIDNVSGARLVIHETEVEISASNEEKIKLWKDNALLRMLFGMIWSWQRITLFATKSL